MAAALILGADYGRYVKSERAALGAPLSVIVFFAIIASLGVISAAVAGNWDPVQIFVGLGLGAFGLLMLILAAWTTNVTGWLRVRTSTIASVAGILLAVAGMPGGLGLGVRTSSLAISRTSRPCGPGVLITRIVRSSPRLARSAPSPGPAATANGAYPG